MAYVVLALGVLMAAVGVDAIATGYPIIQVERGWATVISGTVMLTGGLVTLALGLAIRVLAEIRAALRAQSRLADAATPTPTRIETPPIVPAEPLARDVVPALAGAATTAAALKTTQTLGRVDPVPVRHEPESHERQAEEPVPGLFEAPRLPAAEPLAVRSEPAPHAADAPEAEEHEPDAYELQTPSAPDHDIVSPRETTPGEDEDWLDRALSDFETGRSPMHPSEVLAPEHAASHAAEDAAATQAEVPPIHAEPVLLEPVLLEPALPEPAADAPDETARTRIEAALEPPELQHIEPTHAEPAHPVAEPQTTPAHEPAPHDLAVIGRYESDGTSYIMYADGSIEAQSEAGVYRFSSMAELKAFIEG